MQRSSPMESALVAFKNLEKNKMKLEITTKFCFADIPVIHLEPENQGDQLILRELDKDLDKQNIECCTRENNEILWMEIEITQKK